MIQGFFFLKENLFPPPTHTQVAVSMKFVTSIFIVKSFEGILEVTA